MTDMRMSAPTSGLVSFAKPLTPIFSCHDWSEKRGGERQGTGMYQDGVEVIELDCKVGRATQEDETVEEDDRVREVRLVTSLGDDNDRNEEKNDIGACWPRSAGR